MIYLSFLTGLAQLFPISVPVHEVSRMVDTVIVNGNPSLGKYTCVNLDPLFSLKQSLVLTPDNYGKQFDKRYI